MEGSLRNTKRNATFALPAKEEMFNEYLVNAVVLFDVSEK
jgi:hypothetical protein